MRSRELTATGLATAHTVGRARWLRMEHPPQQTWEQAKPSLRSPVKRTVWVLPAGVAADPGKVLGWTERPRAPIQSLTEPKWPVYAVSPVAWKAATDAGVRALPEPIAARMAVVELQPGAVAGCRYG